MKAINMLWTHNVEKRPSAREASQYLLGGLERIRGRKPTEDGIVV
jgi:hypothetical protein